MPSRDAHLDNVKAILIVLVVVGHAIEPLGASTSSESVYRYIYLFHMPAFVLVTGYLSRRFRAGPRAYLKLVATTVVPYLVFQTAHHLLQSLLSGQPVSWDYLTPEWTLWFLPAMFFWRALTPLLRALPAVLLVAVVVSLIATGALQQLPRELAINRTVQLLPFFVLGLSLSEQQLGRVRAWTDPLGRRALVVLAGFGSLALATWWSLGAVDGRTAFWNRDTATELDVMGPVPGAVLRPLIMLLGVVGTLAVLALAPRRQHRWSHLGRYSVYVYLLHPLVLLPLRTNGDLVGTGSATAVLLVAAAGVLLALVLASRPARRVARVAVEPPVVGPVVVVAEKVVRALPDPAVEAVARAGETVRGALDEVAERVTPAPPDVADVPRPPHPPVAADLTTRHRPM